MSISKILIPILVVVVIISAWFAFDYRSQLNELKKNPNKIALDEVAALTAKIGQYMVLPEGEQPTLATVADPSKLVDQPFFARAKVGDKVLLYGSARKAILYDPVANKILEVAPINIGNPAPIAPPPAPAAPATPKKP